MPAVKRPWTAIVADVPIREFCHVVFLMALTALPIRGQRPASGATITGIVRDSASQAIAGADVLARPGDHRTQTDSAGRFVFTALDPDNYTVRARKLGYAAASWDVKLSKSARVDISIVLDRRTPLLDTITVLAGRECPQRTIEAFLCRRHRGNGLFLDDTDIDDKEVTYAGELFKDIPGFRVDFRLSSSGPAYIVKTSKPAGCITSLVDGRPLTGANPVPDLSSSLIALEVYERPADVPPELQRYTLPARSITSTGRCSVVVYWTDGRRHGSISTSSPPR